MFSRINKVIFTLFVHNFFSLIVKAKFHYTGPTGPARTRTDPHGLCRRPARIQRSFSETRAAKKVPAGPVGSGRARVVQFSYNLTVSVLKSDVHLHACSFQLLSPIVDGRVNIVLCYSSSSMFFI